MAAHVKALGWIYIVLGALGVIGAIIVLAVFGGMAALAGTSGGEDANVAVPLLGGLGGLIFLIVIVVSVPGIAAGVGLLSFRPWARILAIVLSALNLMNIPIGTAIGVYGLWVLLNRDTEALFQSPALIRN